MLCLGQGFLKFGASALDPDAVAQALPSWLNQVGTDGELRVRWNGGAENHYIFKSISDDSYPYWNVKMLI